MSVESLFGGTSTEDVDGDGKPDVSVFTDLGQGSKDLIELVLGDTVDGTSTRTQVGNNATLVSSTGAGGVTQAVVVSDTGGVVAGELKSGQLDLTIALPAGVGLALQGLDSVPADQASGYIQSLLDLYLPATGDPAADALRDSLISAIDAVRGSLGDANSVSVRFVVLTQETQNASLGRALAANEVILDSGTSASGSTETLAILLNTISADKTVVLKNVESAVLVGQGSVRVDGSKAATIAGDIFDQKIAGGAGNDTLIGGGGHDTLTGGAGNDTFGVTTLKGHLVINDFEFGKDKIGFNVASVKSTGDLLPLITGLTQDGANLVVSFGPEMSITLVGVTPEQLTLDMLKFTL